MSDFPPPPPRGPTTPSAAAAPDGRRSRRTPLWVALAVAAVAAVVIGGIAVGSGGDDDGAPSEETRTADTSADTPADTSTEPAAEPTVSPDTAPSTTAVDTTTTTPTTEPRPVEDDPAAAAAANAGVLAEQPSPACPVEPTVIATMADELGSQLVRGAPGRLNGSTFFRQRTTGAAAIVCSAGTREAGLGLYLGPLGEASLRAWTAKATLNDTVRLRELDARGDAAVFAIDSATEVGDLSLAQKGAAWTDGTLVMMLLGVAVGGQRVDVDPGVAGRALVGSADAIIAQLAGIELPEPPPAVPVDEPLDTSAVVTKLRALTERSRGEPVECPVSIGVLDAFNEPIGSTFLNRILDDTSVMGAGVDSYERRGPTTLRCTAGVEDRLVGVYLGTLGGADLDRWLSLIGPTLEYGQVGSDHQGAVLAVRMRARDASLQGAAWTDGDLVVMIAGVGGNKELDFSPDDAASGLRAALPAIVGELRAR